MDRVEAHVEELPESKVRLSVEVPSHDVRHAVDHAASDLAGSLKIPGFRKGKVPMPVLVARIGRERLLAEAVESHIGGWFRNAAVGSRIRPVAPPEYDYELPDTADGPFRFTATVAVQPRIEVVDWTTLEVPAAEPEVPQELVDAELEALRRAVAELAPVDGRPARSEDVVVVDLVSSAGESRRDVVVELGAGRLVEELEDAIPGMSPGETKSVGQELDGEATATVDVTLREIKEKVLAPVDDDLARAASEFDSLAELRADIESRLRGQLEEELDAEFRAAAVDSLERRGISPETYLAVSNQTPEALQERLRAEAERAVSRELALEAVADKLGLEISDEELEQFVREQAEQVADEDPDAVVAQILDDGRREALREDLRLRNALDRVVADVKRIPVDLARAREKLWTPDKEKQPGDTKLWTPGQEE